nr:magnesium-translocating P-type ATPase [uncultured Actinotalea sp.]
MGQPDPPAAPAATWTAAEDGLLRLLGSATTGLDPAEAAGRLAREGRNLVAPRHHGRLRLLVAQFTSPITLVLAAATGLSMVVGDLTDGAIILAILLAGGLLGYAQEHRAGRAVEALLAQVRVRSEVLRAGSEVAVPTDEVVRGDVLVLRAGDVVPADARVLLSHGLLVDESTLTGESFPVDKAPGSVPATAPTATRTNAVFAGTHVVSGTGRAVVVATGESTAFGAVAAQLAERDVVTRFERGMTAFGTLLVRGMLVLVTVILAINVAPQRPVLEALLFSLAIAVGLTPQLLPAIVAVSLAAGARRMAAERVIVRRLDAIEDFGGMTVLCTDKTGTLTEGTVTLDRAVGMDGGSRPEVLRLARLNAALQRGFRNPLDDAVVGDAPVPDTALRLDEVPYDFHRRRLSVLVADGGTARLVTKGAVADVLACCATAVGPALAGATVPLAAVRAEVEALFARLAGEGLRVIAVATRELPGVTAVIAGDERDLRLEGLLTFTDPPKEGVAGTLTTLAGLGISVRVVTGDNAVAARVLAQRVGLPHDEVLTGARIAATSDDELPALLRDVHVLAAVQPVQKERVVAALRRAGETVGYLGDGINDAPALHAADVGVSVDAAADVAKQAAAIVLLDKDLGAVADGVRLGRRTFANTVKYIRVTISANFGNMLSMAAAAAFLPFLPLLPRQILLLNFLSDIPATTIAGDRVDPEQERRPGQWDIAALRRFMIRFGVVSSVFDVLTFLVLVRVFRADAVTFRSAWFVESTATELAALLVLRTGRPAWRSRPSRLLVLTSAAVGAVVVVLPFSPLAPALGLAPLPGVLLLALVGLTAAYVGANEAVKAALRARGGGGTRPRARDTSG